MDAWIQFNADQIGAAFRRLETVQQRKLHVDLPVEINGEPVSGLTAAALNDALGNAPARILISGIGGVGKTSLACQIAGWAMPAGQTLCRLYGQSRMLPVLIEEDCDAYASSEQPKILTRVVRDKLKMMLSGRSEVKISEAFTQRLLERQRILVIVDGLSELSSFTKSLIQPNQSDFPVNFLVVTSRNQNESLGLVKTVISPALLRKEVLSSFMGPYLAECGAEHLFDNTQFHLLCADVAELVGDRQVTVFLAKLYADHVIEQKARKGQTERLNNVVDLVLSYILEISGKVKEDRQDYTNVLVAAKILAWGCLRQQFTPMPAARESAISEICRRLPATRDVAIGLLRYCEERLGLIQNAGPTGEKFKFALDPVAEYLAALHLVEEFGSADDKWESLLNQATISAASSGARGFLIALLDCCKSRGASLNVPASVAVTLSSHLGLTALDPRTRWPSRSEV